MFLPSDGGILIDSAKKISKDSTRTGLSWKFSGQPLLLSSSNGIGWRGFEFSEILLPTESNFDVEYKTLFISRNCETVHRRERGANKLFFDLPPHPRIRLPGDREKGFLRGAQRALNLSIEPAAVERLTGRPFDVATIGRPTSPDPGVEHLLQALLIDVQHGHPSGRLLGESVVSALLHWIISGSDAQSETTDVPTSRQEIERLREWIEANLSYAVSLEDMAAELGMSVRHISRIFRSATGHTPYSYILMRRVERAKQLIRDGRLSLSEVALAVGFANQSHMATTFRKVVGISPSQFGNRAR